MNGVRTRSLVSGRRDIGELPNLGCRPWHLRRATKRVVSQPRRWYGALAITPTLEHRSEQGQTQPEPLIEESDGADRWRCSSRSESLAFSHPFSASVSMGDDDFQCCARRTTELELERRSPRRPGHSDVERRPSPRTDARLSFDRITVRKRHGARSVDAQNPRRRVTSTNIGSEHSRPNFGRLCSGVLWAELRTSVRVLACTLANDVKRTPCMEPLNVGG